MSTYEKECAGYNGKSCPQRAWVRVPYSPDSPKYWETTVRCPHCKRKSGLLSRIVPVHFQR